MRDGHQDLAWAYDFPARQLLPIAGLVAFHNDKIDLDVDGVRLPAPEPASSGDHHHRSAASAPRRPVQAPVRCGHINVRGTSLFWIGRTARYSVAGLVR